MAADEHADEKAALGRFLADPQFGQLSDLLAQFNILRVLRVEDAELRHSNTLAWLLDPRGSHGLGDVVLRRVLSNLLLESAEEIPGLSAAQVELMDFGDVKVRREWHRFDVLAIDPANELVVLIENKVHAGVNRKQLERYHREAQAEFPKSKIVPILLTMEEREEVDEDLAPWIPYSYSLLLGVIERVRGQRHRQLAEPVAIFLSHYAETLRRLTMQDDDLARLCKEIYRRHREAIELIVEHGQVSQFQEVVAEVLSQGQQYETWAAKPAWVGFRPQSWNEVFQALGSEWWKVLNVYCIFSKADESIRLYMQVGKGDLGDTEMRLASVAALREAGFKLLNKAFRKEARYNSFYTDSASVEDFDDPEKVRKAVEKLLAKAQAPFEKARAVFESVISSR